MKKIVLVSALFMSLSGSAFAGGLLTNTNQSIAFLRMVARDGAIGIDGVYSNPAGVAFLNQGLHLSVNWQSAWQTRVIDTTNPLFAMGAQNGGATQKRFKGTATAPVLPSVQLAYNTDKWSFQFGVAVTGGGGKCEFDKGIGSFEGAVGGIGYQLGQAAKQLNEAGIQAPGVSGYNQNGYMQGNQFYFGFTLGAAYKITDNLSVYGGLRALYGTANYKAKIDNIQVVSGAQTFTLPEYLEAVGGAITSTTEAVIGRYMAAGMPLEMAMQQEPVKKLVATGEQMNAKAEQLAPYFNGVNLQCDQTGFGIAPILGIDYKTGNLNVAAKYEFRTHMGMKNKSTVKEAMAIEAVNQFQDGVTVREDSPAMLTLGAEYSILPNLRVDAGYHHFYDRQSMKYAGKQSLLKGGTNEYLGGVEYDVNQKLTVSGGFQITKYGLTDAYMSDMSFVVDSWSFGLGAKYKFNEKVAIQAAYFQTNYDHYKTAMSAEGIQNDFTRTNKVIGVGVDFTF